MRRDTPRLDLGRSREGAAMIEAVMALPVFAIVLAGAFYFHQKLAASQSVVLDARGAAWHAALDACEDKAAAGEQLQRGAPLEHVDQIQTAANRHVSSDPKALFAGLSDIPVVGGIIDTLVPRGIRAERSVDVRGSALLGFPAEPARASAYVACNEAQADPWETTLEVFTSMLPDF